MQSRILLLLTLYLSTLFGAPSLDLFQRFPHKNGGPDTRGAIWYNAKNHTVFVADHGRGLWKIDECGNHYGDTTNRDNGLWDISHDGKYIFAVGKSGLIIYDEAGNYVNSLNGIDGEGIYVKKGYAYIVNAGTAPADPSNPESKHVKKSGAKGGIVIVNVKDVRYPYVEGSVMTGEIFSQIKGTTYKIVSDDETVEHTLLYVTSLDGKLFLLEANGTDVEYRDDITLYSSHEARKLFVGKKDMVYVNSNFGELAVIKTNKERMSLKLVGLWQSGDDHGGGQQSPAAGGVFVKEIKDGETKKTYALITAADGNSDGYLYWLDVTDPTQIKLVDTLHDTEENYGFNDIWLNDTRIYLAAHDGFCFMGLKGARNMPVISVKQDDGSYVEDSNRTQHAEKINDTKTFYLKINNRDNTGALDARVIAGNAQSGWEFTFYDNDKDITEKITGENGYIIENIPAGSARTLKITMTPLSESASDATIILTATNKETKSVCGKPIESDQVSLTTTFQSETTDTLSNECLLSFPGALSSTNDEIQINDKTQIYGTMNHTLITKTLSAKRSVRCDGAPCRASGTLATKFSFKLDLGNGMDGDMILSDNQSLTISSDKAYRKFQTGQNNSITINGDVTIKSQSDFYINQGSQIAINGNVVIYADKFDANQANQFTVNGSLKIIANTFYLNSGNRLYDIPSADKFVVLAKDIIDINSQVDFQGLFYSDGDVQVNDRTRIVGAMTGNYIDVNDRSYIGYDADAVNAFCSPKKKPKPVKPSRFNLWDVDESIDHQVIKTKVVDENITLTFASLDQEGTAYAVSNVKDIEVALFTPDIQLTRWRTVALGDAMHLNITFTPEDFASMNMQHQAFKAVKAFVKYKDANGSENIVTSSDSFAIRPARYNLTPYDPAIQPVAGVPVRYRLTALGATGATVENYNESHNVYDLNGSEVKSALGCNTGDITVQKGDFYHGVADLNLTYEEVGVLDLLVYEKRGVNSEFANIDKSDTLARYIASDTLRTARFKPAKLGLLNWQLQNGAGAYTYYSSDPLQMGAKLDLSLKVTSSSGTVTQNFTPSCYAEDVNVSVTFKTDMDNWVRYPVAGYLDSENVRHEIPVAPLGIGTQQGALHFLIEQSRFHAGQGSKQIRLNLKRIASIARNPLNLTITKVEADTDGAHLEQNTTQTATFVYARAYAPNQSSVGSKMVAKIFYEVYCHGCDRSLYGLESLSESVDSIHWYILPQSATLPLDFENPGSPDYYPSLPEEMQSHINAVTYLHKTDRNHLDIRIAKEPFTTKITYKPFGYLRYDPFNPSVQKHHFTAHFEPKETTWGGKGTVGKTVDRMIGKRSAFDKIDW